MAVCLFLFLSAPPGLLDPDVQAEYVKVKQLAEARRIDANENAIFIHRLRKVYFGRGSVPTKVAVRGKVIVMGNS